ncbi:uncharacterized protein [Chironomus tepperi]|uniref:uncharacterized protein n=1 Tax=Chironomus tepperi TaxID=113505 RepID=UPI00391FA5C6
MIRKQEHYIRSVSPQNLPLKVSTSQKGLWVGFTEERSSKLKFNAIQNDYDGIFWIIALICSVICTLTLIIELVIKVWNFPIVTYMSDESISVSEIDFPAVTVCPRLVLDYHKTWKYDPRIRYEKHTLIKYKYEFEEAAKEFADERSTRESVPDSRVIAYDDNFKPIQNIPFPAVTFVPPFTFWFRLSHIAFMLGPSSAETFGVFNDATYEAYKRKVIKFFLCMDWYDAYIYGYNFSFVPYVIEVMKSESATWWFNEQYSSFNGKYLPQFSEVRTVRGMAYTFNMINADEMFNFNHISSEFDYTNNITTGPENLQNFPNSLKFPLMFNRSDRPELTIKVLKPEGDYARCIKQSFLIHHYDFMPTFASKYDFTSFEFGTIIDVIVTPEITRTDRSLKKLKPTERGCYFEGEKELHFFNTYSQKNCEIECVANFTLETCGCVDIDQPFKTQENICLNISREIPTCVSIIQSEMYLSSDHLQQENCACLPLCDSISYNVKYYTMHEKEDVKSRSYW